METKQTATQIAIIARSSRAPISMTAIQNQILTRTGISKRWKSHSPNLLSGQSTKVVIFRPRVSDYKPSSARLAGLRFGKSVGSAADVHLDAHFAKHGGFGGQRPVGAGGIGSVSHLDVIGLVLGHKLVAGNAV